MVDTIFSHKHFPIQIASTTHFPSQQSTRSITTHCLYKNCQKLRPYTTVHYIHHYTLLQKQCKKLRPYASVHHINNHCTFLYKHVKIFLVSTISITTHFPYANMSKLRHTFLVFHHINHYTFPIQTCKNFPSVHHINSPHISMQTCQNCVTLS